MHFGVLTLDTIIIIFNIIKTNLHLVIDDADMNRVAKTCRPCRADQFVLIFLAGANFWAKNAENYATIDFSNCVAIARATMNPISIFPFKSDGGRSTEC